MANKFSKEGALIGLKKQIEYHAQSLGGGKIALRASSLAELQGELARLARTHEGLRNLFLAENTFKAFARLQESSGVATGAELRGLAGAVERDAVASEVYEVEVVTNRLLKLGFKEANNWDTRKQVLDGVKESLTKGVAQKDVKALVEMMRKGGASSLWTSIGKLAQEHYERVETATRKAAELSAKAVNVTRGTHTDTAEWKEPISSGEARKNLRKAEAEWTRLRKLSEELWAEVRKLGEADVKAGRLSMAREETNLHRQAREVHKQCLAMVKAIDYHRGVLFRLEAHEEALERNGVTHNEARRLAEKDKQFQAELKLIEGLRDAKVMARESDNAGTPMERGTYILMSGKYRGKTLEYVYMTNPNYLANMYEGRFLHSALDRKAVRVFVGSNEDVDAFVTDYLGTVDQYSRHVGGRGGPDLERGEPGRGFILRDRERRGRGMRDDDRTDTTTHRGEDEKTVVTGRRVRQPDTITMFDETTGTYKKVKNPDAGKWVTVRDVERKRGRTRREKGDPDYERWDSENRADIVKMLLKEARQRGASEVQSISDWKKVMRRVKLAGGAEERQVWWKRLNKATGKTEWRKRDPLGWMKRAVMEAYEEMALEDIAAKMTGQGFGEVKPEEVVEVFAKMKKLRDAMDRKAFGLKMKPGDMISVATGAVDDEGSEDTVERELVPGMDQSRHRRGANATDRIEQLQRRKALFPQGIQEGVDPVAVAGDEKASMGWLERVEMLKIHDLEGMQALRREMAEEYHEYNLNQVGGETGNEDALAWHLLNGKINDAKTMFGG